MKTLAGAIGAVAVVVALIAGAYALGGSALAGATGLAFTSLTAAVLLGLRLMRPRPVIWRAGPVPVSPARPAPAAGETEAPAARPAAEMTEAYAYDHGLQVGEKP